MKLSTKSLITIGLLTALEIILSRFLSYSIWDMKIGFAFLPVALAAVSVGPWGAVLVGALGDLVGALLFPIGPFFPGFTVSAAIMGLVFGIFLRKQQTLALILSAVLINQLVVGLFLNTLWISILYGSRFWGIIPARLVQCAVLIPVETLTIAGVLRVLGKFLKRGDKA